MVYGTWFTTGLKCRSMVAHAHWPIKQSICLLGVHIGKDGMEKLNRGTMRNHFYDPRS